jgi:hypothetical protein
MPASTEIASPVAASTPGPSPSARELRPWSWTAATLPFEPSGGRFDGIWALPGAAVAAWSTGTDEDRGSTTLLVSSDGLTWEASGFRSRGFVAEFGAIFDGELTLVGNVGPSEDPQRQVWTTRDGRMWSQIKRVDGLDFGPGSVQSLTRMGDRWLMIGLERIDPENHQNHALTSSDRIHWVESGVQQPVWLWAASNGRRTVRLTESTAETIPSTLGVAWTNDLSSWTPAQVARLGPWESAVAIAATPSGFAIGGQRFVVDDESSHAIGWWSVDGALWHPSTFQVLEGPAGEAAPWQMVGTSDGLIAHGNGDPLAEAIWVSPDGREWEQVAPLPLGSVTALARYGDDVLVAFADGDAGVNTFWRGRLSP